MPEQDKNAPLLIARKRPVEHEAMLFDGDHEVCDPDDRHIPVG